MEPRKQHSTNSIGEKEQHIENSSPTGCLVCGDTLFKHGGGVCRSCYHYYSSIKRGVCEMPKRCSFRRGDCIITAKTRYSCRFCRLQKLYNVGFPRLTSNENPQPDQNKSCGSERILKARHLPPKARCFRPHPKRTGVGGSCKVCGDSRLIGPHLCSSCNSFLTSRRKGKTKWPSECRFGTSKCEITVRTRASCPFCRSEKMKSFGLENLQKSQSKSQERLANDLQQSEGTQASRRDKICQTCDDKTAVSITRGVPTCRSCFLFARRYKMGFVRGPLECANGSNKCVINLDTRYDCAYCRTKKLESLGVIESLSRGNNSNNDNESSCRICGDTHKLFVAKGVKICLSCQHFISYLKKGFAWPTKCKGTRRTACKITVETRSHCCYCRMMKTKSLGLLDFKPTKSVNSLSKGYRAGRAPCSTCGDTVRCFNYRGVVTCKLCYGFIYELERGCIPWPKRCRRGDNKCEISRNTRRSCIYCCVLKMDSLNLIDQPDEQDASLSESRQTRSGGRSGAPLVKCRVCGDHEQCLLRRGHLLCKPCRLFIANRRRGILRWPGKCRNGIGKCRMSVKTRDYCNYCRMIKMRRLGMIASEERRPLRCAVCGDTYKTALFRGVATCGACYAHISIHERSTWPTKCSRGDNRCQITTQTRSTCGFCRMVKMDSLGLINHSRKIRRRSRRNALATETQPEPTSVPLDSSSQPASNSEVNSLTCKVCGDANDCFTGRGIAICLACTSFIGNRERKKLDWPTECRYGTNKCKITVKTRSHCPYCRMLKMSSLAVIDHVPSQRVEASNSNQNDSSEDDSSSEVMSCVICDDTKACCLLKKKVPTCGACRRFVRVLETGFRSQWPTVCTTGQNKCQMTRKLRGVCSYCRMVKMKSFGILDGAPESQPTGAISNDSTQSTIVEPTDDAVEATDDARQSDQETVISFASTEIMDGDGLMSDDQSTNFGEDNARDHFVGFGRRFYGERGPQFRAAAPTRKRKSGERPMGPQRRKLTPLTLPTLPTASLSSHLGRNLCSQLDPVELAQQDTGQSVRCILANCFNVNYEDTGPSVTIRLESRRILIDARPMMAIRMRTEEQIRAKQHPDSVIDPTEDCDSNSSDSDIMEVDCDL